MNKKTILLSFITSIALSSHTTETTSPAFMRSFINNKLWRDKSIEPLEQLGGIIEYTCLDDENYDKQLRLKLVEEALEVVCAKDHDELIVELADILEVIDALCSLHSIDKKTVLEAKEKKHTIRGGFEKRYFVTVAHYPEDSWIARYCVNNPDKYQEIPSPFAHNLTK